MSKYIKKDMTKVCTICGKSYIAKSWNQIKCDKCKEKSCVICGKKFKGQGETCSINCKTEKIKLTNLERYGGHPNSTKEVQNKKKKTCLEKYGVEHPLKTHEIQEKIQKTCLERYGVNYYTQTKEIQEKSKEGFEKKYGRGIINPGQIPEVKEKIKNTLKRKYGVTNPGQIPEVRDKVRETCLKRYGVPHTCILNNIKSNYSIISKVNKKFSEKLKENNIESEFEFYINNLSYDLHILDTDILIEINPTYTHNSTNGTIWKSDPIRPDYHLNKTKHAIKSNYRLINVFEWDNWDEVIENIKNNKLPKYELKIRKNFYNRKTKDRIIDLEQSLNEQDLISKGYVVIYDVI